MMRALLWELFLRESRMLLHIVLRFHLLPPERRFLIGSFSLLLQILFLGLTHFEILLSYQAGVLKHRAAQMMVRIGVKTVTQEPR